MDRARVIQVVEATLSRRGDGKETPIRVITEYFSTEGELLAERDPWRYDAEQRTIRLAVAKARAECALLVDAGQTQIANLGLAPETAYRVKQVINSLADAIREMNADKAA